MTFLMNPQSAASNETHPLLANYVERQMEREAQTASEGSSEITFLRWTTCDEIKRCSCAILSFVVMAALVGSGLVLFWFLWAWFVLYLDLPGVLTPIVWLAGFLLPLCGFKLLQSCPRCTRACLAQPLIPPGTRRSDCSLSFRPRPHSLTHSLALRQFNLVRIAVG